MNECTPKDWFYAILNFFLVMMSWLIFRILYKRPGDEACPPKNVFYKRFVFAWKLASDAKKFNEAKANQNKIDELFKNIIDTQAKLSTTKILVVKPKVDNE